MNILENIGKLISATVEGKIKWKKINPTTFNWQTETSDGQRINTIIQKLKLKENTELYFVLWDLEAKKPILEIVHSNSDEETQNLLVELYEKVSGKNLFLGDIFSDILRDL